MLKVKRRLLRPVIITFLLIGSAFAMVIIKPEWEVARTSILETQFQIAQTVFILTLGYVVVNYLFSKWKEYRRIKNEHWRAQLELLKSKIDPHFFFNTLNNLYGLAMEKSDQTGPTILKLSEVMRYTIYNGEKDVVDLAEEIEYLKQYIEIHKIRYKKSVEISFQEEIESTDIKIAPLLFINLLENAFKHGVEKLADHAFLDVHVKASKKRIKFSVKNNYDPSIKQEEGHGLKNLRDRLALLYPNKHHLYIQQRGGVFSTQLDIQIA